MKALSICQPWAWLIVNGYKDVENRTWRTKFRGDVLIHASQKFDRAGFLWVLANTDVGLDMPPIFTFTNEVGFLGGIVGRAVITDCHDRDHGSHIPGLGESQWFSGPFGFVLKDAKPMPFRAMRGRLGFFEVPNVKA